MATEKRIIDLYKGQIKVVFYPNSHRYKILGERKYLISVTGCTGIIDKSRPLMIWATRLAGDHMKNFVRLSPKKDIPRELVESEIDIAVNAYKAKQEEALSIGTEVHEWVSKYILFRLMKGKTPSIPKKKAVQAGITAFLKWFNGSEVIFYESERLVYSRRHGFVGMADAVAMVNGDLTVLEFKTSKDIYTEHFLQAEAYRMAYEEEMGTKIPIKSMILHFNKESGGFAAVHCRDTENESAGKAFLAAFALKGWLKEQSWY